MQKISEEITAFIKAIGKNDEIELQFQDVAANFFALNQDVLLSKNSRTINIPPQLDSAETRAISDLGACYILFHNKEIHKTEKNPEEINFVEARIFDDFEKMRVIAKIKNEFLGVSKNITAKISRDLDYCLANASFSTLQLILLDEIFGDQREIFDDKLQRVLSDIKKITDKKITKKIAQIAKNFDDQKEFAKLTKEFLFELRKQEEASQQRPQKKQNKQEEQTKNQENVESPSQNQQKNQPQELNEKEETQQQEQKKEEISEFLMNDDMPSQIKARAVSQENTEEKIEFKKQYKIFTSKFDEIILPQKLITEEELQLLRFQLDSRFEKLQTISKRLTFELKKKLMSKQNVTVEQSESDGVLDRKKLTQIVTNPFERNFFIKQNFHDDQNTIVTILLDNSGSMRGLPIVMSALACQIIAEILEKFAIKTEILGFTTSDWKGGKSRKSWERQGREPNQGRLNDLRHIIYKSANQNFKKAKLNLGLMLKEGILKENIDGEALLWARSRLMQREEKRKILMIISDGTPVDDSTNSTNDSEILIDHLHHVISRIEKEGKIELVGIGIGHNVGAFYHNSIVIKNVDELGNVMIGKLAELV